MNNNKKIAIIIGAGPAGLTASYELLKNTNINPIILEATSDIGGISKTVNYKGNRIDIGGHRFFSKSDRIMKWWQNILPQGVDPEKNDKVMLVRSRLSRILYLRKFFDYPVSLSFKTLSNLGIVGTIKIVFSYIKIIIFPIKHEKSLEDFFINRFGAELYKTFFKDYTKKVWGVSCSQIEADWGAQRIKGISISKIIIHAVKSFFGKKDESINQKGTETSLIEKFLYPKYGPGQLWEEVANKIKEKNGKILFNSELIGLETNNEQNKIIKAIYRDIRTGKINKIKADYFFSTMPVKHLIKAFDKKVPDDVQKVSNGLIYRDFITVGLLLKEIKLNKNKKQKIKDNWIYVQEKDVKILRFQIFNNWSPYMVKDNNNIWLGLEYCCNKGDDLWEKSKNDFAEFAINELEKINVIKKENVLDYTVIKMPKTYPAYFGTYKQFKKIREFIDNFENLFLIGRNGMHRYNNMDHSMLTAMTAVENIKNKIKSKENIWKINAEQEYHEEKK